MLTYRARAYALRDVFPDVLKGLTHTYEETVDVTPTDAPAPSAQAANINAMLAVEAGKEVLKPEVVDADVVEVEVNPEVVEVEPHQL
jgi:hypothetical protein